jgi:tyrosyl-tRNA synthetase
MPTKAFDAALFAGEGMGLAALLKEAGLEPSTSEAYRTIQGGGARVNGEQIKDKRYAVTEADFKDGELILQKGKKKFMKITLG